MSIQLMNEVWENGPSNKAARFVLLCLADHASDDGTDCHPSITRIADRCALSRQGVMNALNRLEESGWITRKKGGGRGNPNRYILHLDGDKGSTSFNKADKQSSSFNKADSEKGQPHTENSQPHKDKGSTSLDGNHQGTTNNHQGNHQGECAPAREDPAVKAYHDIMPRRANNIQQEMMSQKIDDVERWREVLREWRGNGWSAQSVTKMIDRYQNQSDEADGSDEYDEGWDSKWLANPRGGGSD